MIGEAIVHILTREEIPGTYTHVFIKTDAGRWYSVVSGGYFPVNYLQHITDEEFDTSLIGLRIIRIASDWMFTIILLSSNQSIHVGISDDFGIWLYDEVETEDRIDWMNNGMFELGKEQTLVPNDWVRPTK
jgi:hypothetical protein